MLYSCKHYALTDSAFTSGVRIDVVMKHSRKVRPCRMFIDSTIAMARDFKVNDKSNRKLRKPINAFCFPENFCLVRYFEISSYEVRFLEITNSVTRDLEVTNLVTRNLELTNFVSRDLEITNFVTRNLE